MASQSQPSKDDNSQSTQSGTQSTILDFMRLVDEIWQEPQRKRKCTSPEVMKGRNQSRAKSVSGIRTRNKFLPLTQLNDNSDNDITRNSVIRNESAYDKTSSNNNEDAKDTSATRTPKIPPIILQDVSSYSKLVREIAAIIPATAFTATTLCSKAVKISANAVEYYRALVKHFRNTNIFFHTYQLKTNCAFKVVLRGLHHSVKVQEIKDALEEENFSVQNVVNIRHHKTKEQLPCSSSTLNHSWECRKTMN